MIYQVWINEEHYAPLAAGTETGLIVHDDNTVAVGDYLRVSEVDAEGNSTGRKKLVEVTALERLEDADFMVCHVEILVRSVG